MALRTFFNEVLNLYFIYKCIYITHKKTPKVFYAFGVIFQLYYFFTSFINTLYNLITIIKKHNIVKPVINNGGLPTYSSIFNPTIPNTIVNITIIKGHTINFVTGLLSIILAHQCFDGINNWISEQGNEQSIQSEHTNRFACENLVILVFDAQHNTTTQNQTTQLKVRERTSLCCKSFCKCKCHS